MRARDRYSKLSESEILRTLSRLRDRVAERFPGSGLRQVTEELLQFGSEASRTAEYLQRPNWPVRAGVGIAIAVMGAVLVAAASAARVSAKVGGIAELAQGLEAAVNDLVFLGVAIWFLVTIETRMKRRRALGALHQLRSVVHIVDMHQLTKDPVRLMSPQPGLSGKVWQKITLLERATSRDRDAYAQPRNGG